jgi:hypothetical protein
MRSATRSTDIVRINSLFPSISMNSYAIKHLAYSLASSMLESVISNSAPVLFVNLQGEISLSGFSCLVVICYPIGIALVSAFTITQIDFCYKNQTPNSMDGLSCSAQK